MGNIYDTKIKKLLLYWFLGYFILISIIISILIPTVSVKMISNVFFGFTAASLLIFLYLYISNKKFTSSSFKKSGYPDFSNKTDEYFSKNESIPKNTEDISRKITKKRNIYISIFATITTLVNGTISVVSTLI